METRVIAPGRNNQSYVASFIGSGINGNCAIFTISVIFTGAVASFIGSGINGNIKEVVQQLFTARRSLPL